MKNFNFGKAVLLLLSISSGILAQMPIVTVPAEEPVEADDFTWWYIALVGLLLGLAGAIYWSIRRKKAKNVGASPNRKKTENDFVETSLDADKELEWLRRNQKIINKRGKAHRTGKKLPETFSQNFNDFNTPESEFEQADYAALDVEDKPGSGQMPIFSIQRLELSRPFIPLSLSNDEALMSAIEQVQEEYEEDEEVRDLSLRILAAFKTRNSIEALSQIALYDLSSNLRSKAVATLTEFDHDSVFEAILLACADPTREVRAAAARGLFRLSFDRADSWTRIAETNDEFKMRASARAAIEADLVKRSFERLVNSDLKSAYEAFTLIALLLRAGEATEVFEALSSHSDMNVRKAILHIIKVTKEPNALDGLYSLLEKSDLPEELKREVDEIIQEIGLVAA
jgi:hypothetical protein